MTDQTMHVRIVPMTADHLDEVAELERICFSTPWSRNMLAEELDNALSAFLVALDDAGRVVGYAGLQVVLDEGYITNVAVRPECRRQGIAGKLLHELAEIARQNGENRVYIATDHANVYEKYGCTYLDSRSDIDGEISRIYTLNA